MFSIPITIAPLEESLPYCALTSVIAFFFFNTPQMKCYLSYQAQVKHELPITIANSALLLTLITLILLNLRY